MTIGKRISELRKAKGYTQEYIAEQLGVSRQAVSKWEQDQTSPDTKNLIALSRLLNESVEYIATGEPNDHVDDELEEKKRLIKSSNFTADVCIVIGILIIFLFLYSAMGWLIGVCIIAFGISMLNQARKLERELQKIKDEGGDT